MTNLLRSGLCSILACAMSAGLGGPPSAEARRSAPRVAQGNVVGEIQALLKQYQELSAAGRYAEAITVAWRLHALYEKTLGPDNLFAAAMLNNLGDLHRAAGQYAEAERIFQRALPIFEKIRGPEHPDVATVLSNLASLYGDQGRFADAESYGLRALAIREKALGPNDLAVALSLNNLAEIYRNQGRFADAESSHLRALGIREKALGPDHPDVAQSLNNLAELYGKQGQDFKAEPYYVRARAMYEKALGPNHHGVAVSLNNLAGLYIRQGRYAEAEPLLRHALAIREKALGPDHIDVAQSYNNLAFLYREQGQNSRAEPHFLRALSIYEKQLGADNRNVAIVLGNLAALYSDQGQYAKAESHYLRALKIVEKVLGPEHVEVTTTLNNLAAFYGTNRRYADAERFLLRALAIREKALGPDHPYVAVTLNNLAALYDSQGRYAEAGPRHRRALAIREKVYGPEHVDVSTSLNNIAEFFRAQGQYAEARQRLVRAQEIAEKALGPEHPSVATILGNLASAHLGAGDVAKAVDARARANAAREAELRRNLVTGSAEAKRLYLQQTDHETDWTLTIQAAAGAGSAPAARLGLEQVLRRKGRALDALVDQIAALARTASPEARRSLAELSAARAAVARLTLAGPGREGVDAHRRLLAEAAARADALEAQVSAQSARARAELSPVSLDAVTRALPPGAALVELAVYGRRNPRTSNAESTRYVAWVLTPDGRIAWADLGEAAPIDRAAAALRAVLRRHDGKPLADVEREVKPRARALDALVFEPVRRLLAGRAARLLVAPDGQLSLVPFDALVDERGRFATESYEISYLTSGRDLLRLQARGESRSEAEIVADPNFGAAPAGSASDRKLGLPAGAPAPEAAGGSTGSMLSRAVFGRLPGTADEARALAALLPGARVRTGEAATKREVLALAGPRVLHVATHGFFLEGERAAASEGARGLILGGDARPRAPAAAVEDPLLRSGLAFAGANLGPGGDGILTSLEAAGLDLWGTRLVVLSACDTGVGEVRTGDGVYGLRRALVLAGAETQVMSLWPVSDAGTRDLMIGYYRRLAAGEGRSAAMRAERAAFLEDPKRAHPYYWASFIVSGAWEPIDARGKGHR